MACPYHALERQLARLHLLFTERLAEGIEGDLPLFPDELGQTVTKEAMTSTIVKAAELLGLPTASADGSARVSGHTLRVTGAQGLARAGLDVWAIQLLGRWGSATVLEYIQEVPLERAAEWATRASLKWSMDLAAEKVRSSSSSGLDVVTKELSLATTSKDFQVGVMEALGHEVALGACELTGADKFIRSAQPNRNIELGRWHRVPAVGMVGPIGSWVTACGAKFSSWTSSLVDELPEVVFSKVLCAKCLPKGHASALVKERS